MAGSRADSVMRAGDIGRAARQDLQLRVPRRPVVRRGVRVRSEDGAWVVEGARKGRVLRGQFAQEHLGALLEACDGTHDLHQVGELTGAGEQAVFEAVSLLWTGGIVEEGDTQPLAGPPVAPELACLLSRLGDSTGVNESWQDAARRLAAARVAVMGAGDGSRPDEGLAQGLVEALEPTLTVRLADGPRREDTLVVLVETGDSQSADPLAMAGTPAGAPGPGPAAATSGPVTQAQAGPTLNGGPASVTSAAASVAATAGARAGVVARLCWELGVPLLRVRVEHEALTVGPYVDRAFSPCLECAVAGEPAPGPVPGPARRDLATGLAARAVAALVSRATMTHLPGDVRRTDLATLAYSDRPVTTRPGCPVCSVTGAAGVPVAASAPVGARYEQSVAIPPAAFTDPKGHQQHYKPANLRLQHEFRDWPSCPRTPLPPADLSLLERPWPEEPPVAVGEPGGQDSPEGGTSGRGGSSARHLGVPGAAGGVQGGAGASPTPEEPDRDRRADGRAQANPSGASPTQEELATILALAVGVREPTPQGGDVPAGQTSASRTRRWTAAGGNIGSVAAYVLVPHRQGTSQAGQSGGATRPGTVTAPDQAAGLDGGASPDQGAGPDGGATSQGSGQALPAGTYAYVEQEHALALVGPAAPLPPEVGVRLVLTGSTDKLARKYLAFALRIAVQDCGCSFEVARIVARALGVPLRARARWDEREVAAVLGTDPEREPVCAVVDLGGGLGAGPASLPATSGARQETGPAASSGGRAEGGLAVGPQGAGGPHAL